MPLVGAKKFGLRQVVSIMAVVLVAVVVIGCGSSSDKKSPASVRITAPEDGATVKSQRVTIRGTVTPADATVQAVGQSAQVTNGVFTASVRLNKGDNRVDVTATASGSDPATTAITVTRRARSGGSTKTGTSTSASSSGGGTRQCGEGITVNSATSCPFALRVRDTYTTEGGPTIKVYSPVTGQTYTMNCGASGAQVTCRGGNNAVVTF